MNVRIPLQGDRQLDGVSGGHSISHSLPIAPESTITNTLCASLCMHSLPPFEKNEDKNNFPTQKQLPAIYFTLHSKKNPSFSPTTSVSPDSQRSGPRAVCRRRQVPTGAPAALS